MGYKRSKPKLSLATIEKRIKEQQIEISSYEMELANCRLELQNSPVSKSEIDLVSSNVIRLQGQKIPNPKLHTLRWIIGLEDNMEAKNKELEQFYRSEDYTRYELYMRLILGISSLERQIRSAHYELQSLENYATPLRLKKDKLINLRAAAAANAKETRDIAANVRSGLTRQSSCPYCGGDLGKTPHVDHIYPVSKGGRSVPKNMVYVCAKCNILKTSLTLSGFIQKFSLDRDIVEGRLQQLNKEF
jgi:5-methylcytosine-specific restriction endonuclease McrA